MDALSVKDLGKFKDLVKKSKENRPNFDSKMDLTRDGLLKRPKRERKDQVPKVTIKDDSYAQVLGDLVNPEDPAPGKRYVPRRGRPRLKDSEKVNKLSICLKDEDLELLDLLANGRGISSKIRDLISRQKKLVEREKEQTRKIVSFSRRAEKMIEKFKLQKDQLAREGEELSEEILKIGYEIRVLLGILSMNVKECEHLLTRSEFKALEVSVSMSQRKVSIK